MSLGTIRSGLESSSSSGFFSWLREREEDESIWHCCWDASPPEKSGAEEEPVVVIDIGSYNLRAHVAEKRGDVSTLVTVRSLRLGRSGADVA